ncbi:MAG: hypothetical protein ACK5Z5_00100 [Neisseriaceae bacterium]
MKKSYLLINSLAAIVLIGCNSGGTSNTPASGNQTQYNLQNYAMTQISMVPPGDTCTFDQSKSTINCDSKATFAGEYKIEFNTPKGSDGAYVVMPPEGDHYGLNIAATGEGCPQEAPQGGEKYVCHFTIGANGTAKAGKNIDIKINGSLGNAKVATINLT